MDSIINKLTEIESAALPEIFTIREKRAKRKKRSKRSKRSIRTDMAKLLRYGSDGRKVGTKDKKFRK